MDINEAREVLNISKKELDAIEDYINFKHASINLLSDLEPTAFIRLKGKWRLPEKNEELEHYIEDFVNIYSAMYKQSSESKGTRGLIRGTSEKGARAIDKETRQFISASSNIDIAKTFCPLGDAALVRISIGDGVPHLYAENYREENSRNEEETIIAPFCKVTKNEFASNWQGFKYYNVQIEKGELEKLSQEEIDSLREQAVNGYEQNVKDMQDLIHFRDECKRLSEKLSRPTDSDDRKYTSEKLKEAERKSHTLWERTSEYKQNLRRLLQGLCKEKELEIDQAKDVVKQDREKRAKDLQAMKEESERKKRIQELSQKISHAYKGTRTIDDNIVHTYKQLLEDEKRAQEFAEKLGVKFSSDIAGMSAKDLMDTRKTIQRTRAKLEKSQVPEDNTVDQTEELETQYRPAFERIGASVDISTTLKEVEGLYKEQSLDTIKKSLYEKTLRLINNAKIRNLQEQRGMIESEKVGLFGKLTGKGKLKQLRLENIDLRISLLSNMKPAQKNYYSVKEMLTDLYAFKTVEMQDKLTPEITKFFDALRNNFGTPGKGRLSIEYIRKLAEPKIEEYRKRNLPVIQNKKFRVFGGTREQITSLENENAQIQTSIRNNKKSTFRTVQRSTPDAINLFRQRLNDISNNFEVEGPIRTQSRTDQNTEDIWK